MRVFFSNHSTAPVNLGGAERSLIALVEAWQRRSPDFEPVFLTKAPQGEFVKAIRSRDWRFHMYRFRGWALPSRQPAPVAERTAFAAVDYAAVSAMIRDMEREKPDLVVTNTLVAPWAAFAAKTLGIPHAWFVREYGDIDHGLEFQIGRHDTLSDIGLLSEAVFTNSLAVKEHLSTGVAPEKISVVYPTIDTERVRELSRAKPAAVAFPQTDPGLRIVVVGRVEPGKGQHRVIDALGLLERAGTRASLCIVGSWKQPGYDIELRERARALDVESRITFTGEQENPYALVAAADVCVTPSDIEAFGRTTLEYLTIGRPVVASNTGGSAELISPGVTGALFDPTRPEDLAAHLQLYADSPELIAQHGEAATRRASELIDGPHSIEAAIVRLERLVGSPAYRLPHVARYWFQLPVDYSSLSTMTARMAVGLLASRVKTRTGLVGRTLARPAVIAKRVLGR